MATNRNSTPDPASSSLRPPQRGGHHLRASADMSFNAPMSARIRPSSEVYLPTPPTSQNAETEAYDKAAEKWLADLESYENTLDEMAAATLDQDFKDELSAIEQWFRVLSEAERTAALYALLQQTTPVQIRFFIAILQQMGKSHPTSGILSPANFDKDPLSSRMSELMVSEASRHSYPVRRPPSPTTVTNRNSQLDPATVSAMFPDAAAALVAQRARLSQIPGTNTGTKSNRNSAIYEAARPTSLTPGLAATKDLNPPNSPWRREESSSQNSNIGNENRKTMQDPMGAWQAPPPSAGLRSPRNPINSSQNLQTTTILNNNSGNGNVEMPELSPSPYGPSWASMVNTPVAPMFNTDNTTAQANADMVANATAMKLAAMSTVNNRILIDADVKKFRRSKPDLNGLPSATSPGLPTGMAPPGSAGIPSISQNLIMFNERGQPVQITAQQAALLAAQQNAFAQQAAATSPGLAPATGRSRPTSPGFAFQTAGLNLNDLTSPQHNGFLTAYQPSPLLANPAISLNQFGLATAGEGYISDHSDPRGRSPRGRRGSSKPPEDPTDPKLLQDISAWLRSLRLHKYTDNLKDLKWSELIELDDAALEARGVNALGARRKMLKVFEQVKEAKDDGKLLT